MAKILGLDLGTNSIGWAIVEYLKENNIQFELQDKGVLVFDAGVLKDDKGKYKSKTAERTTFRGIRKLKLRLKVRKYETLKVLIDNQMCPLDIEQLEVWKNSNFTIYPCSISFLEWLKTDDKINKNPYYLRDKASKEKILNYDLGRVFYHLAQRRGFLSNRLDKTDDSIIENLKERLKNYVSESDSTTLKLEFENQFVEFDLEGRKDLNPTETKIKSIKTKIFKILNSKDAKYSKVEIVKKEIEDYLNKPETSGLVKEGIKGLDLELINGKFKTIGQYFYSIYNKEGNILKEGGEETIIRSSKIRNHYTGREEHYLTEFNLICLKQGIDKELKDKLLKAIFFQRPLKSQKGLVGYCNFQTNKRRCNLSRPEFEEFRMKSFINNIKIKTLTDEKLRRLDDSEIKKIKGQFYRKTKPTFDFIDLVDELIPKGKTALYYKNKEAKTAEYVVNYKLNTTVQGCPTISNFISILGNDWKSFEVETSEKNKKDKFKKYNYIDIWHAWQTFTDAKKLKSFAVEKLGLDEIKATKFSSVSLKTGYCDLSLSAIEKINKYLEKGLLYSHAVFMANIENVIKKEFWNNSEKEKIQIEIGSIIDAYSLEKKYCNAVNDLLSKYYEDKEFRIFYSKEAEPIFKKELWNKFEDVFGKKVWNENEEKDEYFSYYFDEFLKKLQERKRIKIETLEEKVKNYLLSFEYCDEKDLKKLYHPSAIEKFKAKLLKDNKDNFYKDENGNNLLGLGSPLTTSIKNPMAMKTVHQLRKLINTLLIEGKITKSTIIHVETARELNDNNKRKAIEDYQKERENIRSIYRQKIEELYFKETGNTIIPNDEDITKFQFALEQREDKKIVTKEEILKYELWEEQNHVCLYTGKTIRLSDFLGKNSKFDIEHTLPRGLSQDNSLENKTLADSGFNRNIKKQLLPNQLDNIGDVLLRIRHWKDKYQSLYDEIEGLKKKGSRITDKEQKDKNIQQRHKLKMEYDYWYGKHNRFVMEDITDGFKNSQKVDTGLITRFAQNYLKSCFERVYPVKGTMTDEFRRLWAKDVFYREKNGKLEKNRDNHTHHCKDAVVIACITKDKYDSLAKYWEKEDENKKDEAKEIIRNTIPWKGFAHDLKEIEETVLVKHVKKDVMKVTTFKKLRKKGKLLHMPEYVRDENGNVKLDTNGKKIKLLIKDKNGKEKVVYQKNSEGKPLPIIQRSDSARGSLHLQSYIAAIAKPILEENKKPKQINGRFILQKDPDGNVKKFYVIRKELAKLNSGDVKKIVDDNIREIIEKAVSEKKIKFKTQGATIEGVIWQNEEKKIPIFKVRLSVDKSPIEIKNQPIQNLQSEKANRKKHKQFVYAVNEENYCMALYEGYDSKGKLDRVLELVNYKDASEYYKIKNAKERIDKNISLIPEQHIETGYKLMSRNEKPLLLIKGLKAILLKNEEEFVDWNNQRWLNSRLYTLDGIDTDGIKFNYHQEARNKSEILKFMNYIVNKQKIVDLESDLNLIGENTFEYFLMQLENPTLKVEDVFKELNEVFNQYFNENNIYEKNKIKVSNVKPSGLTTPKGDSSVFIDNFDKFPFVKYKVSNFAALIENIDFKVSIFGNIEKIEFR